MSIIAIATNKGGAGKTTLSINLAAGLAHHGSAAILDADPQRSALQWHAMSSNPEALPVFEASDEIREQIVELQKDFQYIVTDCPPSVEAAQTYDVLLSSDVVLIPVQPSPMDLWATTYIEDAIVQVREHNPSLAAMLVINQVEVRSTLSKLIGDALTEVDVPVAATPIRRRAIYRTSILEGRSVYEMGKRGAEAAAELDQLIDEVIK